MNITLQGCLASALIRLHALLEARQPYEIRLRYRKIKRPGHEIFHKFPDSTITRLAEDSNFVGAYVTDHLSIRCSGLAGY